MSIISALEPLLERVPGVEPVYLQVHEPSGDRAEEGVWETFESLYSEVVSEIAALWGPPVFDGCWEDPGFPKWHHWVARLAYWKRGESVAFVECDQQDNELPITLCIGAKSSEEQLIDMS